MEGGHIKGNRLPGPSLTLLFIIQSYKMIVAISLNFQINKLFKNADLIASHVYGERSTIDLQTLLTEDLKFLENITALVTELNSDLNATNIGEIIAKHTGVNPAPTARTKTRRTYSVAGLTVHEQDVL